MALDADVMLITERALLGNSCVVYPGDAAHIVAQGVVQAPNSRGGCHLPAVFPPN
jgi:hypothetical protein